MFDPRVDILRAEWSAFQTTQWMKPLLNDLAEYRNEIRKKAEYYQSIWPDIITVFVADFPGFHITEDIQNTVLLGAGS